MSRVLVIGGWPPSLVNFRGKLLEAMRALGHEVITCAGGDDPDVAARLNKMGVLYLPLHLDRTGINPLRDLGLLVKLIRLMRAERPDVVLAYTIKPIIYGLLAARFIGVKQRFALVTGLGYAFIADVSLKQRLIGWLAARLYKLALKNAATVFFQNNDDLALFQKRKILSSKAKTVRVMGSGVDLHHFAPMPLPERPVVFLLIARLLADKGIREYVEAARIVHHKYPKARFALLGPYDVNPAAIEPVEVQSWVKEGVIEYWGETNDVTSFIGRCTVYVLPSYREGMPRSVLEAMSMRRPIITTDVPGCRDTVIDGKNGYLVPVKDISALALAMMKMLSPNAPLAEMGKESRLLAEQHFGVSSVNRVILDSMGL